MTEKLTLQQVFRNGRRIDGHKRAVGSGGMLVQCTGHQFLAGTRFAGDHDRYIALRQSTDGSENILHGGRLTHHLWRRRHEFLSHFFALTFFKRASNQLNGLGQVKRLGQVFKRAILKS